MQKSLQYYWPPCFLLPAGLMLPRVQVKSYQAKTASHVVQFPCFSGAGYKGLLYQEVALQRNAQYRGSSAAVPQQQPRPC